MEQTSGSHWSSFMPAELFLIKKRGDLTCFKGILTTITFLFYEGPFPTPPAPVPGSVTGLDI